MRKILLIILSLCMLCACDNTPKGVLSKGDMEDVLFDYHLAQAMVNDLPPEERALKGQEYIDAVFRKHGITQEEFDSSLVWYSRNMKAFNEVYLELQSRYNDMNKELQLQNGNNDMMAVFSTGGDTTNLWNSNQLIVLRDRDLLNKESFTIKADTSFHKDDTFILMCKVNLILESQAERSEFVSLGLSLSYKDGTTQGTSRQTFSSGAQQITIMADDVSEISKITGFFYFNGNSNYRSTAFIDDIKLVRMHKQNIPEQKADSDSTKAVRTDTLPKMSKPDTVNRTHISPEQLRIMNMSAKKIEIKEAPEVRTPNRYGTRKKRK